MSPEGGTVLAAGCMPKGSASEERNHRYAEFRLGPFEGKSKSRCKDWD